MTFIFNGLDGIIVDYYWYSSKVEEIDSWCEKTFGYQPREGMALTFQEESDKMWFMLKWNT